MKKVLIVENDLMIADIISEFLCNEGFVVCGIAATAEKALHLADEYLPHLAIVDVRLARGDLGTTVAPILMDKYNTGVIYTTGNVDALSDARGQASLRKPFHLNDMILALNVVSQIVETGTTTIPIPSTLTLLASRNGER